MDELGIYILTANCARNLIDIDLFAAHFFDALSSDAGGFGAPSLIVLSLQEIAPIAYSFLGGSYLTPYFDAFVKAIKKAATKKWDAAYVNFLRDHTGMTGLMVFARADLAEKIAWVDTAHVGFGMHEMGNKGAVGARVGYSVDSSKTLDFTFVAAHLAPMEDALEQRNLDWQSIVERLVFSQRDAPLKSLSSSDESTALLEDHDESSHQPKTPRHDLFAPDTYLFLAGDLNYRTSNVSPSKEDVTRFPRRDVSRDSPSHYLHLLEKDQLMREMRQGKSFHGLSEAAIDFPPTYKYSDAARKAARLGVDSDAEWKWSSHRWPSWCDRILYLDTSQGDSKRVRPRVYDALPLLPQSDHRPVALAVSVHLGPSHSPTDQPTDVPAAAPFAIDPHWRSRRDVARRKELVIGVLAYLGLTWEGNGIMLASILGILGTWVALQSLWSF